MVYQLRPCLGAIQDQLREKGLVVVLGYTPDGIMVVLVDIVLQAPAATITVASWS